MGCKLSETFQNGLKTRHTAKCLTQQQDSRPGHKQELQGVVCVFQQKANPVVCRGQAVMDLYLRDTKFESRPAYEPV